MFNIGTIKKGRYRVSLLIKNTTVFNDPKAKISLERSNIRGLQIKLGRMSDLLWGSIYDNNVKRYKNNIDK